MYVPKPASPHEMLVKKVLEVAVIRSNNGGRRLDQDCPKSKDPALITSKKNHLTIRASTMKLPAWKGMV